MKILYFTPNPPFPPHRGDQLIAYEQIRNIDNKEYKVFLVSLFQNRYDEKEIIKNLDKYCEKIYLIKIKKIHLILSMLKTFYNFKPFQVNMYSLRYIKKKMSNILVDIEPDLIHVQTIRLSEIVLNTKFPLVLDMIDILSLNMRRRADKESIFKKILLNYESFLLKSYETKVTKKFTNISVVSKNDLLVSKFKSYKHIFINPTGTSLIGKQNLEYPKEKIIMFHGNMSYFPNIESMEYFIREIWPIFYIKHRDYKFYIVGKNPPEKLKVHNGKNNVVITGFVSDIAEYLSKASVGLYPMFSGTGMQNKILEALACGLPTIASSIAIQGIVGVGDNELIIANSKDEILNALELLIENKSLSDKYKINGPIFIKNNFSWLKNVEMLITIWNDSIKKK
jgi:glycosyltransferase involved in cell wall biosynthesis